MSGNVSLEIEGGIARVTIDDGKANALSPALIEELSETVDRAADQARAVVLCGRPGRFCAGFDLKVMMAGPDAMRGLVIAGADLFLKLYELPRPLVIACTGHALAGGALLVATGDTRIGALGEFKIGLNEVRNGMSVPILAHELARDRLDPRHLVEAVLQARIYDPTGAVEVGWLDRAVEPAQVVPEAVAEAERLAGLAGSAYATTKRSLRRQTLAYIRDTLASNMVELTGSAG